MSCNVDSRPSVTVKLSGGLGNQLFQYAAARALALRSDARLILDTTFYRSRRHRDLELDAFPIQADGVLSSGTLSKLVRKFVAKSDGYREPHFHFDPQLTQLNPPVVLDGYFQSERYFNDQAPTIRGDLRCPEPVDDQIRQLGQRIRDSGATSLHVRRGDYVTNKNASGTFCTCTMDYYRNAMERIPGDDPVYVFSDDLAWAKENLPPVKNLIFAESDRARRGLDDLWLMTHARNHIIANSTFSWWGAWLADSQDGLTIAPVHWFVDESTNDRDLIPAHWIRVA
tara:strand:- start:88475 stop:89326 length:852 start_codon:yes stop_codon:yes gene_type:complete